MENLKKLRGNIKSRLTRFQNFLEKPCNRKNYSEIKVRLHNIENSVTEFENIENKIADLSDDTYESQIDDFENTFFQVCGLAQNYLDEVKNESRDNTSVNNASFPTSLNINTNNENEMMGIKLQPIDVPKFDGLYEKWVEFKDSFEGLVHDNEKIPDIRKLQYLKQSLTGDASKCINHLQTSKANYTVAWELVKERFDNKRIIVQRHIKAFMELPAVVKESAEKLRKLLDESQTHFRSLEAIGQPVKSWDAIVIYIITSKLDICTLRSWEKTLKGSSLPTSDQLFTFLKERCESLESTAISMPTNSQKNTYLNNHNSKKQVFTVTTNAISCPLCKGEHRLWKCEDFIKQNTDNRSQLIKSMKLCFNCFHPGHRINDCNSTKCKKCNKMHHTMLHKEYNNNQGSNANTSNSEKTTKESLAMPAVTCVAIEPSVSEPIQSLQVQLSAQVLLATALIDIIDNKGIKRTARILLDSCSMSNFITESFARLIGIPFQDVNIPVSGLNQLESRVKHSLKLNISSKYTNYNTSLEFLVIPNICGVMPMQFIKQRSLEIPSNIKLADPNFNIPSKIDALIGAEIYFDLLCRQQIKLRHNDATLQKTLFGWVVAGKVKPSSNQETKTYCYMSLENLNKRIERFWEIEELPEKKFLSEEEALVEAHYAKNISRDKNGRYIARLPFNKNKEKLGESFNMAEKRFFSLERRLRKNPELKKQYIKAIREFQEKGYMKEILGDQDRIKRNFIPHQAVIKENSFTTKLRVVFDASAKTSTGFSLNDTLRTGPTLQEDVFSILMRFRKHNIAMIADIEKMYLQVKLHTEDIPYQCILWRENEQEKLKAYSLQTVIFGTAPAAYLATKTLLQLANDERVNFSAGASVLEEDFYVDNVATGADTLKKALIIRNELINITSKGGFTLRQWASNNNEVTKSLPDNLTMKSFSNEETTIKTLGIHWDTQNDEIVFKINYQFSKTTTKRTVLSDIAILFDPIGLLAPVIIKAKIIMQSIWKVENLGWDQKLPNEILNLWTQFKYELNELKEVKFPRKCIISETKNIEIHGFCDASEDAYSACIYIRSTNKTNKVLVRLVSAKTRVAPLKSKLTIAKLELCGASLLSNLLKIVIQALKIKYDKIYLWSDSSTALQWINTPPYKLKTFVANKVSQIASLTNILCWRYVPSEENPADCISRGQMPSDFSKNSLWKDGPEWLVYDTTRWPERTFVKTPLPELKLTVLSNTRETSHDPECMINYSVFLSTIKSDVISKYSSFIHLRRIIAYCLRFVNNAKKGKNKLYGTLQVQEFINARNCIIKLIQKEAYEKEIKILIKKKETVQNSSDLKFLNPYLDEYGLIRVGGRLQHASIPISEKNPIVLPKNHFITKMIIREEHLNNYHCGINATLNAVRSEYWPIAGRSAVKAVLRKCIDCFKAKPSDTKYLMGNLPENRVTFARPFSNAGVDFCGPIYIKEKKHRNTNKVKVYVAVFVCFATKACHLEVVSDLTADSFIACLKRFFARRGKSKNLYSDNGTNFVGAKRELEELRDLWASEKHNEIISRFLTNEGITWHFNPAGSPHFGGLWEAAVKSFKRHLFRTVGYELFTFEELNTYVIEIEGILNSRPITSLSTDPNDFQALTPAHFLIGESLKSIPEPSLQGIKVNQLSSWQHIQVLKEHFWRRWHKEYLNEINTRTKWQQQVKNDIKLGKLVILKEDNVPVKLWMLGRIQEVYPGKDGIVRVVSVRTQHGVYKRCVQRVAPLPIE